jgi:hypothetical protein
VNDIRRDWPPAPESITTNPHDHAWLTRQLPTATIYGRPIPDHTPILQNPAIPIGTARIHINGTTADIPFAPSTGHGLQWTLPEPYPTWQDMIEPEAT